MENDPEVLSDQLKALVRHRKKIRGDGKRDNDALYDNSAAIRMTLDKIGQWANDTGASWPA